MKGKEKVKPLLGLLDQLVCVKCPSKILIDVYS